MLGSDFKRALRSAQAGDSAAFVSLWRDANPAMIRYLRVVGRNDAYDGACEGWITVVRGLSGFHGDETAWRVWLLACARLRAEEGSVRRRLRTVSSLPHGRADAVEALEIDELSETDGAELVNRGVNETIAAIRELPLVQGEILMLRLGVGLPVPSVADVVGTDALAVRRSEARALQRLGADRELIIWSLSAPPMPAELADERVAMAAFRSLPAQPRKAATGVRVIALAPTADGVRPSKRARRVGFAVGLAAGRSRAALAGAAAVSAAMMSLGGLSAAAYVGALPAGLQHLMHQAIGAPEPSADGSPGTGSADQPNGTGSTGAGVGPNATGSPAPGLCRAWQSDRAKGTARAGSVAFRNLAAAAGGAAKVDSYCTAVLATAPGKGGVAPTHRPNGQGGDGKPAHPQTPNPHSTHSQGVSPPPAQGPASHPPHSQPANTHPTKAEPTTQPRSTQPRSTQPTSTRSTVGKSHTSSTNGPTGKGGKAGG